MDISEAESDHGRTHDFSSIANTPEKRNKLKELLIKEYDLSEEDEKLITDYLMRRKLEARKKESFGIVYAITQYCNLACKHCGVNAKLINTASSQTSFETSGEQVRTIIDKIQSYGVATKVPPFLMFGGGEPTLRSDFKEILAYAARQLGAANVGFCTNGTLWTVKDLLEVESYVDVIEISIDGLATYHNDWRNPRKRSIVKDPYSSAMSLISESLKFERLRQKLEVSSIVTKSNQELLPALAKNLRELNLKAYSVHRAMPVGRMALKLDQILGTTDYMRFFVTMARIKNEEWSFGFHLHHSLESIYSALFLGEDIHQSPLPMGSIRHSIGINWSGSVHFDPWSLIPPFDRLTAGNLLTDKADLVTIMHEPSSTVHLASEIVKKNVRCKRCTMPCTGGMRLNAIGHYIQLKVNKSHRRVSDSDLVAGLSQIDPACPLYEYDK